MLSFPNMNNTSYQKCNVFLLLTSLEPAYPRQVDAGVSPIIGIDARDPACARR
jgi:hypothetical protein